MASSQCQLEQLSYKQLKNVFPKIRSAGLNKEEFIQRLMIHEAKLNDLNPKCFKGTFFVEKIMIQLVY